MFGFLSGTTPFIIDSLLDAQDMGAKTNSFTSALNKDTQAFTETVLVASQAVFLYPTNLCSASNADYHWFTYAYFLERESKEKIFNSYWEMIEWLSQKHKKENPEIGDHSGFLFKIFFPTKGAQWPLLVFQDTALTFSILVLHIFLKKNSIIPEIRVRAGKRVELTFLLLLVTVCL